MIAPLCVIGDKLSYCSIVMQDRNGKPVYLRDVIIYLLEKRMIILKA